MNHPVQFSTTHTSTHVHVSLTIDRESANTRRGRDNSRASIGFPVCTHTPRSRARLATHLERIHPLTLLIHVIHQIPARENASSRLVSVFARHPYHPAPPPPITSSFCSVSATLAVVECARAAVANVETRACAFVRAGGRTWCAMFSPRMRVGQ